MSLDPVELRDEFGQASVLLMTSDADLAQEVRRVAAGVAVPVVAVADPHAAMAPWQDATLVLVGGDCAAATSHLRPARRSGVLVVSAGVASSEVLRSALDLGAAQVVELPTSHDWLVDALVESGEPESQRGKVVGFVSAAGGSGASTLAVATACVAAESTGVVLVDLDPVGIGVERLIGYDGVSVTTWDTLGARALGPRALRDALPFHRGVRLVGFGSSPPVEVTEAAAAAVLAACGGSFGLTVLDVPRVPLVATRQVVARCDLVVVVAPQSVGAALAGYRVAASLPTSGQVVLVTRAGPRTIEPAAVAEAIEVPLLAEVSDQRGLDEALAAGLDPLRARGLGLRRAANAVLERLDLRA